MKFRVDRLDKHQVDEMLGQENDNRRENSLNYFLKNVSKIDETLINIENCKVKILYSFKFKYKKENPVNSINFCESNLPITLILC